MDLSKLWGSAFSLQPPFAGLFAPNARSGRAPVMKTLALQRLSGKRGFMLTRILHLLKGNPSDPLTDADARLALGALMVRVGKSDDTYQAGEIARIEAFLGEMNDLDPIDAAQMRATCENVEAEAPSTRKFALLIRETVSLDARLRAHAALWQVLVNNGPLDDESAAFINTFRDALGLRKADCDAAQARAVHP